MTVDNIQMGQRFERTQVGLLSAGLPWVAGAGANASGEVFYANNLVFSNKKRLNFNKSSHL